MRETLLGLLLMGVGFAMLFAPRLMFGSQLDEPSISSSAKDDTWHQPTPTELRQRRLQRSRLLGNSAALNHRRRVNMLLARLSGVVSIVVGLLILAGILSIELVRLLLVTGLLRVD